MALYLISVPIGHPQDITLRALETLRRVPVIIVEERKESTVWLRAHAIAHKKLETLNEHSTVQDIAALMELCRNEDCALITDCGSPGFCDPGADLVGRCRSEKIAVHVLPGPSSLPALLSLSSQRLDRFFFFGFLSNKSEIREEEWKRLSKNTECLIVMDTPYRLKKTLADVQRHLPKRRCLWALNLTQENEQVIEGTIDMVLPLIRHEKAEFLVLIYPEDRI